MNLCFPLAWRSSVRHRVQPVGTRYPNITGILCLWIVVMAVPSKLSANAGVFGGSGYDIELIRNDDIRMVSETVTIVPGRGREPFDGGLPGLDRVSFTCHFVLQNLRAEPVSVQVGFPLDSEYLEADRSPDAQNTDLGAHVEHYRFVAHDGQRTYSLRHVPGDKKKKFRSLFMWDMDFAPDETKNLRVSYQIPIAVSMGATYWRPGQKWPDTDYPDWQENLADCMVEWFSYVTATGASWAGGVIGKATFSIRLDPFDRYIATRPLFGENKSLNKNEARAREKLPTLTPPVVRLLAPSSDEWKPDARKKEFLTRELHHFRPTDADNIHVLYYLVFFPMNAQETERFVGRLGSFDKHQPEKNFGGKPDRVAADFDALRDIFREFNGERTGNPAIEKFVSGQHWRGVEPLKKIPDEVFQTVERLRSRHLGAPPPSALSE